MPLRANRGLAAHGTQRLLLASYLAIANSLPTLALAEIEITFWPLVWAAFMLCAAWTAGGAGKGRERERVPYAHACVCAGCITWSVPPPPPAPARALKPPCCSATLH